MMRQRSRMWKRRTEELVKRLARLIMEERMKEMEIQMMSSPKIPRRKRKKDQEAGQRKENDRDPKIGRDPGHGIAGDRGADPEGKSPRGIDLDPGIGGGEASLRIAGDDLALKVMTGITSTKRARKTRGRGALKRKRRSMTRKLLATTMRKKRVLKTELRRGLESKRKNWKRSTWKFPTRRR